MNKLGRLIEELEVLLTEPPWDSHALLKRCFDRVHGTIEMDALDAEGIRRVESFRISLHRTGHMTTEGMVRHLAAEWTPVLHQAVLHLSIGKAVSAAMERVLAHEGTPPVRIA